VHDVADGGLLVALAEMAMASGLGVKLDVTLTTAQAFGEDQSRYIVTTKPDTVLEGAVKLGVVGRFDVAGVAVFR
jgi:phosphoribosylformylglycinamidine synthase